MKEEKKEQNRIDLEKYTELQDQIGDMFTSIKQVDDTLDMSSLDQKLAARLETDLKQVNLSKSITKRAKKENSKPGVFTKEAFAWAGGSFISMVGLAVAVILIIPQLMGGGESISDLSTLKPTPAVRLQPTNVTASGYIAPENSFTLETESAIRGNLKNAIKISPEVDFEVTSTKSGDGSTISLTINEELARGSQYTVSLVEGVKFEDGSELRKSIDWVFKVEPVFAVRATTPRDKATNVPVDSTIEFEFNHKNISAEELAKFVKISPNLSGRYEQVGLKIVFLPDENLKPESEYKVVVSGEFANTDGEKLGEDYSFGFTTGNQDSSGKYLSYERLFWRGDSKPIQNISGNIDVNFNGSASLFPAKMVLYSVPEDKAVAHIASMGHTITGLPEGAVKIHEANTVDSGYQYTLPSKGFYILSATSAQGNDTAYKYYVKTDLGIIANQTDGNNGYLFDMNSEKAVEGVEVDIYNDGDKVATVKTNGEGFYTTDKVGSVLIGKQGSNWIAFTPSRYQFNPYIGYQYGGFSQSGSKRVHTAYVSTDRPLYRPGDTVYFSAIVRKRAADSIALPGKLNVNVVADESRYYTQIDADLAAKTLPIFEKSFETDPEFGVIEGSFSIPYTQQQSFVSVELYVNGEVIGSKTIDVSEYTKPDQQFSATFEKTRYFAGEAVNATITGTDYSDQPLSGTKVRLVLYRSELDGRSMASGYYDKYGVFSSEKFDEKIVTLDSQGRYSYSFTPLKNDGGENFVGYRVAVMPIDQEFEVLAADSIIVSDTQYDIELAYDAGRVITDSEGKQDVTLNFASKAVWGGEALPNKNFKIEIEREWYDLIDTGEEVYDEYTKTHRPVYRAERHTEILSGYDETYKTDGNGLKSIKLGDLSRGSYHVKVKFEQNVKEYKGQAYVTDLSYEYTRGYGTGLTVAGSKYSAKPGEKVEIQIASKRGGNGMYITTSSNIDKIGVIKVDPSGVQKFEVEIKDSMAPYLYICAYMIVDPAEGDLGAGAGKGWESQCTTILVESDSFMLNVKVESDKSSYLPGQEANLTLTTTDAAGKPVASAVTLAVVDQALLDLANKQGFSNYSQEMDKLFIDLKRTYSFEVGNTRYNYEDGFGAGGGGDEYDSTRSDFPDTAYWNPKVVTDSNGKAKVKVVVPDSLTTWNVLAYGTSRGNQFGKGTVNFTSQVDQYLDIEVPQFVRNGDKMKVKVEAANFGAEIKGKVLFTCEGCVEGTAEADASLSTASRADFTFNVEPNANVSEVKLTAALKDGSGKQLDAVRYSIPVYSDGIISNQIYSDILDSGETSSQIKFNLDNVRKDATKVNLLVSKAFTIDSYTSAVDPTLKSTAQIAAAVLQDSFMLEHYEDLNPDITEEELLKRVIYYLEILDGNQAGNGGFGWFSYDAVSLESSALAAEAIIAAEDIRPLPAAQRTLMAKYFISQITSDQTSVQDKIIAFKALALVDGEVAIVYAADVRTLFEKSPEVQRDPLAIAMFMQAYNALGSTGDTTWLAKYLPELANETDRGMSWDDIESNYKVMGSSDYVTSAVYLGLAPIESWETKYKVRNWLLDRNIDSYKDDKNAAAIVYALAVADAEDLFDFDETNNLKLVVNGKKVEQFSLEGDDQYSKVVVSVDSKYLREGENTLKLSRDGVGDLYVTATVKSVKDATPTTAGFAVTRELVDLDSGRPISEMDLKVADVVKVRLKVVGEGDYTNVVVRDYIPSGMEPVRFNLSGVSTDTIRKFWSYTAVSTDRSGVAAKDYVSFSTNESEKGKEYQYEYLLVVTNEGELDGGATHVFLEMFPDIHTYVSSEKVVID